MKRKIGFEISHCSRMIKRYMDSNAIKSYIDEMTGTHGWALKYFYKNRDKDIFQRDFEREFDIRRSTASSILSLMEKNGLITRQSVESDGRLKKIMLTDKAVDIHKRVEAAFDKMEEDIMKGISEEETEAFLKTLDRIKSNIERMSKEND